MRLTDEQIHRLADVALNALIDKGETTLKVERGAAIAKIVAVVEADRKVEAELDRKAEQLLATHMRAAGATGNEVDERKLFNMIKKKLADEQGYPL